MDEWLTPKEIANELKVSTWTVLEACRQGRLQSLKTGAHTVRIRREWLEAWIDGQTRGAV